MGRAVDYPWEIFMIVGPGTSFAVLLRRLRKAAFLTQEDLANAARLSTRAISDLERGLTRTTRKDTAHKLADALNLTGSSREDFVAAALGRSLASGAAPVASGDAIVASSRPSGGPQEWLSFVVTTLDELGVAAARSAVADWQSRGPVDAAWLSWVATSWCGTASSALRSLLILLDCAIWRDGASHWQVSRRPDGAHVHVDPGTVLLTTSAAPLMIGRKDHLAI